MASPISVAPVLTPPVQMPSHLEQHHDDDIVIFFGDDATESNGPSTTKFEIVNQWKRVQKDFCQVEPLAGAYLEGTILQRGDYVTSPFPLKIIFKPDTAFNYSQISQSPAYVKMILDYLEMVLQTRVDLRLELQAFAAGQAPVERAQIRSSYERDKEREPILAFLAETFETSLIGSRTFSSAAKLSAPANDESI